MPTPNNYFFSLWKNKDQTINSEYALRKTLKTEKELLLNKINGFNPAVQILAINQFGDFPK